MKPLHPNENIKLPEGKVALLGRAIAESANLKANLTDAAIRLQERLSNHPEEFELIKCAAETLEEISTSLNIISGYIVKVNMQLFGECHEARDDYE